MKVKQDAGFSVVGTLTLSCKREDGSIVNFKQTNMIVNYGLIGLATVIAGGSAFSPMTHLAMGDGTAIPSLGDDELINELRRDAATVSQLASPEDNKVQFQVEHAQGAVIGTFREAGLFDGATAGATNSNMFNRIKFTDFSVASGDTLTVTWLVEVKNA